MSTVQLASVRAVLVDGSTPLRARPAVQPLVLPQYASGHIALSVVKSNGDPANITGKTFLLCARKHATDLTPALSLEATITNGPNGLGRFELIPGHWLSVPPRRYGWDMVEVVDTDDRPQVIPASPLKVTDENVHPGDAIQVPNSQQPLAQGPQGAQGPAGAAGPAGPAGAPGDFNATVETPGGYPYPVQAIMGLAIVLTDSSAASAVVNLPSVGSPNGDPTVGMMVAVGTGPSCDASHVVVVHADGDIVGAGTDDTLRRPKMTALYVCVSVGAAVTWRRLDEQPSKVPSAFAIGPLGGTITYVSGTDKGFTALLTLNTGGGGKLFTATFGDPLFGTDKTSIVQGRNSSAYSMFCLTFPDRVEVYTDAGVGLPGSVGINCRVITQ
jgi:hypothetical protein